MSFDDAFWLFMLVGTVLAIALYIWGADRG